jgi:hypothetical protein
MGNKQKRPLRRLLAAATLAVFAVFTVASPVKAATATQSLGGIMYEYPTIGSYWDDITDVGGDSLPFVIVNPASGPGVSVDPIYTAEIAENTADGIRSIGYVSSNYQTVNWQDVYDDIDDWYQMYPGISGIFIDLIQDGAPDGVCYVAGLYNHVKNNYPNDMVVSNPGTHISMDYEPYSDIFMNAENTYAVYQSAWNIMYPGWEDNPAYSNRFWHAIHTVDPSDYTAALALTRANNAGWVYLTDDVMPNPYKVTPTYWNTEVSDVDAMPDSTIPNRGKTELPSGCRDLTATTSETKNVAARQATTTSNITVANTSASYPAEPATKIAFTLPQGVTLGGSGSNWTCDATSCSYASTIAASGNAAVLGAAFTTDCDYDGTASVSAALSNFAGNEYSFSVTPEKPADCSSTLANTGVAAGASTVGALSIAAVAGRVYFSKTRIHYKHIGLKGKR